MAKWHQSSNLSKLDKTKVELQKFTTKQIAMNYFLLIINTLLIIIAAYSIFKGGANG